MSDESVASIIASHTDGIFFPNIRELLKILHVCLTYWKHRGRKVIVLSPQTPHLAEIDNDHGQTL